VSLRESIPLYAAIGASRIGGLTLFLVLTLNFRESNMEAKDRKI
jgi:hypothetical protein